MGFLGDLVAKEAKGIPYQLHQFVVRDRHMCIRAERCLNCSKIVLGILAVFEAKASLLTKVSE